MRCLIVDDDDICRKFLAKALHKHGTCDFATHGEEAVNAVSKSIAAGRIYDVVFLDIMMPVMNGRRALSAIRDLEDAAGLRDGFGTKIIMTTAIGDYDSVRNAFEYQCDGYLVKPLKLGRLTALMANLGLIPKPQPEPDAG